MLRLDQGLFQYYHYRCYNAQTGAWSLFESEIESRIECETESGTEYETESRIESRIHFECETESESGINFCVAIQSMI